MTRYATPPQHGERRCYLRGCRRDECRDAAYKYMSRYRLDRERGQARRMPADSVHQRVVQLTSQGWTAGQIAAAAQCSERAVLDLQLKRHRTVDRTLASRLLQATPSIETAPDRTFVNAAGTIRRLHALIAIGHQVHAIADAMGIARTALSNVINGIYPKVTISTARKVKGIYAEWSQRPGSSVRSKNYAIKRGWAPPAAWDDDTIDDPASEPNCGAHTPRYIALAEDCAELERQGHTREQIAERLGVTRDGLQRALSLYRKAVLNSNDMRKAA